jgi:protein gp37
MADGSAIEWTEATWNPTTGCDRLSAGCDHCYALTLAKRLKAMGAPKYQNDGDPRTSGPGFGIAIHPDALRIPYGWREPRVVFVNSMSDLSVGVKCPVLAFPLVRTHAFPASCPRHVSRTRPRRHPSRNRMASAAVPVRGLARRSP